MPWKGVALVLMVEVLAKKLEQNRKEDMILGLTCYVTCPSKHLESNAFQVKTSMVTGNLPKIWNPESQKSCLKILLSLFLGISKISLMVSSVAVHYPRLTFPVLPDFAGNLYTVHRNLHYSAEFQCYAWIPHLLNNLKTNIMLNSGTEDDEHNLHVH